MKGLKKLTALLLAMLLVFSVMSGGALAAEEEEEDTLADAYLYCQEDGMPKYWLDFTGAMADDLVLHAYFRSSDPTFYESWFILDLDTADIYDDMIEIHNVYDEFGFDRSDWFESFTLLLVGDDIILDVERDESTLAGGTEDNILTGIYWMEPMAAGLVYEYYQEDGMRKYWLDLNSEDIILHAMFRSEGPDFYESYFTFAMDDAEWDGDYTVNINTVYDSMGLDISRWFKKLVLTEVQGAILMDVERDESTMAGGSEDNILTGVYMFEPRTYFLPLEEGPFTAEELGVLAQQYYFVVNGFFPPEADVEDNGDGTFTIHLYETVDLDGMTHTATSAWYTVDDMSFGTDDISGQSIYLAG